MNHDERDPMEPRGSITRAEYSLAGPTPVVLPPDPYSELRDEMAKLEDEAMQLLRGCKENALVHLSPVRRVFEHVARMRRDKRSEVFDLQERLAEVLKKNEMFAARLKQLEGIVQSAFARAVKGLSANAPAAQAGADKVVRLVEEHAMASRFLDQYEVPGATLAARVQWLHDKATQTMVADGVETTARPGIGTIVFDTTIGEPGEKITPGHWGPVGNEPMRCNWLNGANGAGDRCVHRTGHEGAHLCTFGLPTPK